MLLCLSACGLSCSYLGWMSSAVLDWVVFQAISVECFCFFDSCIAHKTGETRSSHCGSRPLFIQCHESGNWAIVCLTSTLWRLVLAHFSACGGSLCFCFVFCLFLLFVILLFFVVAVVVRVIIPWTGGLFPDVDPQLWQCAQADLLFCFCQTF